MMYDEFLAELERALKSVQDQPNEVLVIVDDGHGFECTVDSVDLFHYSDQDRNVIHIGMGDTFDWTDDAVRLGDGEGQPVTS